MKNRGLWIGVALGAPIIAWAVIDALGEADRTKPFELARWIVGAVVIVDLVVIPAAFAVGRVIGDRAPLRWALATGVTLVVVGWPFLRGYGRRADNPSLLPRNYGAGTAIAVALVTVVSILWWSTDRIRKKH